MQGGSLENPSKHVGQVCVICVCARKGATLDLTNRLLAQMDVPAMFFVFHGRGICGRHGDLSFYVSVHMRSCRLHLPKPLQACVWAPMASTLF